MASVVQTDDHHPWSLGVITDNHTAYAGRSIVVKAHPNPDASISSLLRESCSGDVAYTTHNISSCHEMAVFEFVSRYGVFRFSTSLNLSGALLVVSAASFALSVWSQI